MKLHFNLCPVLYVISLLLSCGCLQGLKAEFNRMVLTTILEREVNYGLHSMYTMVYSDKPAKVTQGFCCQDSL